MATIENVTKISFTPVIIIGILCAIISLITLNPYIMLYSAIGCIGFVLTWMYIIYPLNRIYYRRKELKNYTIPVFIDLKNSLPGVYDYMRTKQITRLSNSINLLLGGSIDDEIRSGRYAP